MCTTYLCGPAAAHMSLDDKSHHRLDTPARPTGPAVTDTRALRTSQFDRPRHQCRSLAAKKKRLLICVLAGCRGEQDEQVGFSEPLSFRSVSFLLPPILMRLLHFPRREEWRRIRDQVPDRSPSPLVARSWLGCLVS
jgi:hypothetical protein